jgi:hypothetical protein
VCPKRIAQLALSCLALCSSVALADDGTLAQQRPDIQFFRWQEDWSYLADPANRTEPGDDLKYIPLNSDDPFSYLSLGLTLRERYESKEDPTFGLVHEPNEDYLIHRLLVHLDAHLSESTRVFIQLNNELAPGLQDPGPVDANRLDLGLAFIDFTGALGDGRYRVRFGRQEMAFDLQRFISVRDGPNVRQAYDAIWGDYELKNWRISGFASQPVQDQNVSDFDDYSNHHLQYDGTRIQTKDFLDSELSFTLSRYLNDYARFPSASGQEQRFIGDVHLAGKANGVDWDVETMLQGGYVAEKRVEAWAAGGIVGYTYKDTTWQPRVGLQADAASGNRDPNGNKIETFNPLFPNGYYVTLSGYTGYTNFIHLKPSLTLTPEKDVTVLAAIGGLWRQTTHDAVYAQPDIPVPGTVGLPGRYTATYGELRVDWKIDRAWAFAVEADHYMASDALKSIGGKNSDYFGVEIRWGW